MSCSRYRLLREEMVQGQLLTRGINNQAVLAAFKKVPRHRFVPAALSESAYLDRPLAIGCGQTISQPFMVALISQLLEIKPGDKVLEVGIGSGYQAAILLEMGAKVYGIERQAFLSQKAGQILSCLGYSLEIKTGDGSLGWKEFSPFDKIVVSAAASAFPPSLIKQLKAKGIIVAPLGPKNFQQLTKGVKNNQDQISPDSACNCVFVPLIGKEGW